MYNYDDDPLNLRKNSWLDDRDQAPFFSKPFEPILPDYSYKQNDTFDYLNKPLLPSIDPLPDYSYKQNDTFDYLNKPLLPSIDPLPDYSYKQNDTFDYLNKPLLPSIDPLPDYSYKQNDTFDYLDKPLLPSIDPPQTSSFYQDPHEWNRNYGCHHLQGPSFSPKAFPGPGAMPYNPLMPPGM